MATKRKDVETYTASRIRRILNSPDPGAQKAALANLRRGIGYAPGELPQLWGEFLMDMPEELYGFEGQPSRAEWAVYIALTLFALHQQGHDPAAEPMHREGQSLGAAVAQLASDDDEQARILRRLNAAATANSIPALAHYLRGLVQLLRGESIPLDYPALAGDVFDYQNPEKAARVRLRWGQDFYGTICKANKEEDENT